MTLVPAAASPARHGMARAGAALMLPSAAMLTLSAESDHLELAREASIESQSTARQIPSA
jgi:hypothetical protein